MKRRELIVASAIFLGLASTSFAKNEYPIKPIKIIVPYPPGAGPDDLARLISDDLSKSLGVSIFIENRSGAGTNIAAELVSRANPDGYTLMYADNSLLMFNEHLYKNISYSPKDDFEHVASISVFPLTLVLNKNFPANNFQEFIEVIKNNPGKYNYASPGIGTPHHLTMELLKAKKELDILHVPYRGTAPALIDLLTGEVSFMFASTGTVLPVKDKIKVIAIAADERSKLIPEVPTLKENLIDGVEASPVQGIVAPKGTPNFIVEKLNNEINKTITSKKFIKRLEESYGAAPSPQSPLEFKTSMRSESERWGPIIKSLNINLD